MANTDDEFEKIKRIVDREGILTWASVAATGFVMFSVLLGAVGPCPTMIAPRNASLTKKYITV